MHAHMLFCFVSMQNLITSNSNQGDLALFVQSVFISVLILIYVTYACFMVIRFQLCLIKVHLIIPSKYDDLFIIYLFKGYE